MDLNGRDSILQLDDVALARLCALSFCKGSGKGGQKRNKTSSLARVHLIGTDWAAEDCSERSQHINRHRALRKLRMKIAFQWRAEPTVFEIPKIALNNPAYPALVAKLLDWFEVEQERISQVAKALGVTTAQLNKVILRDTELFQEISRRRKSAGLDVLNG